MEQQLTICKQIFYSLLPVLQDDYKSNKAINSLNNNEINLTYQKIISQYILSNTSQDKIIFSTDEPNNTHDNSTWYVNSLKGSGDYAGGVPLFFTTITTPNINQTKLSFIIDYYKQSFYWTSNLNKTIYLNNDPITQKVFTVSKLTLETQPKFESSNDSQNYSKLLGTLSENDIPLIKFPESIGLILVATGQYASYLNPNFSDLITLKACEQFIYNRSGVISTFSNTSITNQGSIIASNDKSLHNQLINTL